MIDLSNIAVVLVALAPIVLTVFILSILALEYIAKKLVLAGAWVLGSVGLIVMGEDI